MKLNARQNQPRSESPTHVTVGQAVNIHTLNNPKQNTINRLKRSASPAPSVIQRINTMNNNSRPTSPVAFINNSPRTNTGSLPGFVSEDEEF